jgi:hypothetical protein
MPTMIAASAVAVAMIGLAPRAEARQPAPALLLGTWGSPAADATPRPALALPLFGVHSGIDYRALRLERVEEPLLVFRYTLSMPPLSSFAPEAERARFLGGVGALGIMGYSLLGSYETAPDEDAQPLCLTDCAVFEESHPDEAMSPRRKLLSHLSLGVGVAALSGAVWLTLSDEQSPFGKRTQFGLRPVPGGSVGLIGARF